MKINLHGRGVVKKLAGNLHGRGAVKKLTGKVIPSPG